MKYIVIGLLALGMASGASAYCDASDGVEEFRECLEREYRIREQERRLDELERRQREREQELERRQRERKQENESNCLRLPFGEPICDY